jgi:hypothetical protein
LGHGAQRRSLKRSDVICHCKGIEMRAEIIVAADGEKRSSRLYEPNSTGHGSAVIGEAAANP